MPPLTFNKQRTQPIDWSALSLKPAAKPLFVDATSVLKEIPESMSKTIGQPFLRSMAALGGAVTGQPLTPETDFQKDLYGTDKPITLRSSGAEYGIPEKSNLAPIVGFAGAAAELIPGSKGTKQSAKAVGNLTTKFLEYAKNKTTLSRQEILDFARRPELKKGEADMLLKKLEEFEPKAGNKILELPRKGNTGVDKYYQVSKDTYIHQFIDKNGKTRGFGIGKIENGNNFSPFEKTKIGGMDAFQNKNYTTFEGALQDAEKLAEGKLKARENGTNTELFNQIKTSLGRKSPKLPAQEFTDSIRSSLLELKPVKVKEPQYSRTTVEGQSTQYDNRLQTNRVIGDSKNYEEVVFESPITTNGSSHYPNSKKYFAHARGDEVVESGKKIWREQEIQSDLLQKEGLEQQRMIWPKELGGGVRKEGAKLYPDHPEYVEQLSAREKEVSKLDPFTNDRFGERIMRERIKEKAQAGYEKYRMPTGETIGKIEGFENHDWRLLYDDIETPGGMRPSGSSKLTEDKLEVGARINMGRDFEPDQQFIITDILGEGRFKAVPKDFALQHKEIAYGETSEDLLLSFLKQKVDEKVVSKRFYNEMKGLGSYYREESIKEKYPELLKEINDKYSNLKNIPENEKETFDLTGKSNPQYRRYENWGKFLKNKYGAKEVTDPQGNTWYEADITKEHAKAPVEAFGKATLGTVIGGAAFGASAFGANKLANLFVDKMNPELTYNRDDYESKNKVVPRVKQTLNDIHGRYDVLESGTTVRPVKEKYQSAIQTAYKTNPTVGKGIAEAILMMESSMGTSTANRNPDIGKYAYLVGFTKIAKQELIRNGIHPDLDTPEGAIKAALDYWNLQDDKYATPAEVYNQWYSNGKLKPEQLQRFQELVNYYANR